MDWRIKCRCSAETQRGVDAGWLGKWCGRVAVAEDGLCVLCHNQCLRAGKAVLTLEQAQRRHEMDEVIEIDQGVTTDMPF